MMNKTRDIIISIVALIVGSIIGRLYARPIAYLFAIGVAMYFVYKYVTNFAFRWALLAPMMFVGAIVIIFGIIEVLKSAGMY